jgi:hypothetical protein
MHDDRDDQENEDLRDQKANQVGGRMALQTI